jgi:hypothetical protein
VSAFDELQRQLVRSVAARADGERPSAAAGLRWWRRARAVGLGSTRVVVSVVLVAAVAAATFASRHEAPPVAPVAQLVSTPAAEGACRPCRAGGGVLHTRLSASELAGGVASVGASREAHARGRPPLARWTTSTDLPSQTAGSGAG